MASKCTITFDNNPLGVYYAGQVLSGTAELITVRPKTIRSIYITISGFAEVRWTDNVTKQDTHGKPQRTIETFSASEMYYAFEHYVYGEKGPNQMELASGKYTFPFHATIPPNAPTSFNGSWGHIQHEVTVVIDRVMRYDNVFKQGFSVISPFDLNLNPQNTRPLEASEEKTFCWGLICGTKGPMTLTVKVPYGSYVPGQKVKFNLVLDNQSDVHCYDVKVRLMRRVVYTSRSPEEKVQMTEVKVADNHCGEVVKLNKAEFDEFLEIPSTTPSSLASCSIIKITYTLKFIAKLSRIHGDLVVEFPFTIGTVPLYPSTVEEKSSTTNGGPAYKPLPPPGFEEGVCTEQFENNTYKPRYPVFFKEGAKQNINSNSSGPPIANSTLYPSIIPAAKPLPMPESAVTTNASQPTAPPADDNLEVLGFSLPPDYKPTPSGPVVGSTTIGWK